MKNLVLFALTLVWLGTAAPAQDSDAPVVIDMSNSVLFGDAGQRRFFEVDLGPGGSNVAITISSGCATAFGTCEMGQGFFQFVMRGNTRVELRAAPDFDTRIDRRRVGLFEYAGNARLPIPEIYYDLWIEAVPAEDGPAAFTTPNVYSPYEVSLAQIAQSREDWRHVVDLRRGPMLGRIYIQPLLNLDNSDIFAAPGTYSAGIRLSIFQR